MGRASSLLDRRRTVALVALLAALSTYYSLHASLWQASTWWDVAFLAFVLMPVTFGLVYLVLPLRRARGLLLVGLALVFLAFALHVAHAHTAENFAKLAAATALGFWFLTYFETVGLVVLVAALVACVDILSVWRGPTRVVVTHHERVFTAVSYAFPVPGENAGANLGPPDLLFFALFLAAAARFRLRTRLTWVLLVASFGATIAFAVSNVLGRVFGFHGLPALPLLSLSFLGANADLLWRRLRPARKTA